MSNKKNKTKNVYFSEQIWKQPDNYSTYYNYKIDSQCTVPIRSLNEILNELGRNAENVNI